MLDADFASRPLWVAAFSCMLTIAKFPLLFSLSALLSVLFKLLQPPGLREGRRIFFYPLFFYRCATESKLNSGHAPVLAFPGL
jgi:hypothetical protein